MYCWNGPRSGSDVIVLYGGIFMLKFNEQGRFKIVQFTDVHRTYGEGSDVVAMQLMEEVLDQEKPDLVFYTGDLVSGGWLRAQGYGDAKQIIQEVVTPAVDRNLPWAVVFGNHDAEANATNEELLQVLQTLPGCLTEAGPESISGVGNYVLEIASQRDASHPAALIYGFDSGDRSPFGGWAYIQRDQIAWYVDQASSRKHQYNAVLPALAFLHIPLPEYNQVWDEHVCRGTKWENVCCPKINTGLFAAMVEMGDVRGVFCGHDHTNDYEGELHGIRLVYGRSTGGYSRHGFEHGARIIELEEGKRDFKTWIRLAGHRVIHEQTVHEPDGRTFSPIPDTTAE